MSVAEKLRKLRGGRLQREIADKIGISRSAIAMYETGLRVPRDPVKVKFAKFYGVTVQSLFFEDLVADCDVDESEV